MREIKFRGRNYDGIWMYGYLMPTPKPQIHLGNKHCVCACPQKMSRVDVELYEVEESTIGQYTGLKDKNGKEIYEGDIIGCCNPEIKHLIFYNEKQGRFMAALNGDIENDFIGLCGLDDSRWNASKEVIGNIHENPELIKEKEK